MLNTTGSTCTHGMQQSWASGADACAVLKDGTFCLLLTSLGSVRMMVSVVMSRATRVLVVSLVLSTLLRQATTYLGPLLAFTMTAHRAYIESQKQYMVACRILHLMISEGKVHDRKAAIYVHRL